jgi:hypothetical protein
MGGVERHTPFSHFLSPLAHLLGKSLRARTRELLQAHNAHAGLATPI